MKTKLIIVALVLAIGLIAILFTIPDPFHSYSVYQTLLKPVGFMIGMIAVIITVLVVNKKRTSKWFFVWLSGLIFAIACFVPFILSMTPGAGDALLGYFIGGLIGFITGSIYTENSSVEKKDPQ